jgi:hypothetical protein
VSLVSDYRRDAFAGSSDIPEHWPSRVSPVTFAASGAYNKPDAARYRLLGARGLRLPGRRLRRVCTSGEGTEGRWRPARHRCGYPNGRPAGRGTPSDCCDEAGRLSRARVCKQPHARANPVSPLERRLREVARQDAR